MGHLVLLGAGASYGSGEVSPYPPPLGKDLFNKLEELGGVASKLPQNLKNIFIENFEKGMAEYNIYSGYNIMSFQRELAGYLAGFTPLGNNNYIKLIKSLNKRRVIYSSLNYDLLFELSAHEMGFNINYSDTYTPGFVRLLKIHGSSNFWPNLGGMKFFNATISGSFRADVTAPVTPLSQMESIRRSVAGDSFAPAIAMFAEGKQVKVCPDYVKEQQKMWIDSIKRSSKIFIIGVRVHQADEHIWKTIGESSSKVYYFGFPKDEQEFIEWKKVHNKQNAYFRNSDFSKAIKSIKTLTLS